MGKYRDRLAYLQERLELERYMHNHIMTMWGSQMSDWAKEYNRNNYNRQEEYYQREIRAIEGKAQQEMVDEITQQVLKNISVEVKNEASPAIKEIKKELDNLFKGK